MARIVLLPLSPTYRVPALVRASPEGLLNCAAVPVPLAAPWTPEPAQVLTTPAEVMRAMRWLLRSAT